MKFSVCAMLARSFMGGWLWLGGIAFCAAQSAPTTAPYLVSVKHITTDQGLPNQTVLGFGQDAQGFVWIGTPTAAYRFDGKQFTPPTLPTTKQQTYNTGICGFGIDHAGNFWLQDCVNSNHRNQYLIRPGGQQPEAAETAFGHAKWLHNDPITEFAPSPDHIHRYFRTYGGKIVYQTRQGKFRLIFQHPDLAFDSWRPGGRLFQTKRSTVLISLVSRSVAIPQVVVELDSTGRTLNRYTLLPNYRMLPIWEDADGSIYLHHQFEQISVTRKEVPDPQYALYKLSPDKRLTPVSLGLPPSVQLADTYINYDEQHGLFWITGPQLLVAWHPRNGIVFDLEKSGFPFAHTQRLKGSFVDRTGAVWVNGANGFLLLTLEPNLFRLYVHQDEKQPTASWQSIRAIFQLDNQLWVNAPICQLIDLNTGKSKPAISQPDIDPIYTRGLCPLVQTADSTLWFFAGGVLRYDPKTARVSAYNLPSNTDCVSAWADNRGKIWLGLQQGMLAFDTERKQPVPFTQYNQFSELRAHRITGFFPDRAASVKQPAWCWLTASSGLYQFDPVRGVIARYSTRDEGRYRLPFDHIAFIHPDSHEANIYWLATLGGGLVRWNRADGTYQQFTTKQGLSDNTLYAIYEDKFGRLWLPSNNGLMSFQRKTHQIQIYHTKDGIADEEFNLMAHYRAPDGRLFLGGLNGITAFYPDQIQNSKPTAAPLLVAQYQKLDTETGQMVNRLADYRARKEVHLTPADRLFKLSFALLDYRYLGQTRLWYRISNWQEKWVVQDGNELSLNGLPAGSYTLQVRAQTSNADWVSSVISVPITVEKPVYLRGWFLFLCLLIIAGLIMAVFWWRSRQFIADKLHLEAEVARRTAQIEEDKAIIERQAIDLQKSAVLKSRFFANVTHEFKTPLTLLLGPLQYISGRITDMTTKELVVTMDRNARQLLTLVNDLLDLSRLDSYELKLYEQPADVQQVVNQVMMGFMTQAHYTGITLSVSGNDQPCPTMLDVQKFETVLRNLIANALRFTPSGGYVQVRLSRTDESLQVAIEDNGSGIHPGDLPHIFERYFQSNQPEKPLQGGTGIGLALCQEYCHLWGGSLSVDSLVGQGSTFTMTYPMRSLDEQLTAISVLPVEPINLPNVAAASENGIELQPLTDLTLMLIDDNADMLLYAKTILAPYYSLRFASNGRQALQLLNSLSDKNLPDLIISDIMMPEIDGLTLINELRIHPLLRNIPVILLTARADLESRLQALRLGVADYLTKPFYEAELLTRIQNLLRRSEERAGWFQEEAAESVKGAADESTEWIQWLEQTVRQNLNNQFFNTKTLADMANVSERQLNRRVRALTGFSPGQFIQEVRLQVAYDLIEMNPDLLVKNVAMQVGYHKVSYFSQLFRDRFGLNPEEHIQLSRTDNNVT